MTTPIKRVGLIVPSSNTTMETEIPKLLRGMVGASMELTFHGSRVRMRHVERSELEAMNAQAQRAMTDLMDAPIDAVAYACLVAIMAMGEGYHRVAASDMEGAAKAAGKNPAVVTSAGALVEELKRDGVKSVAMVMPYADGLARAVASYIEAEGISVRDYVNLSVTDNTEVGRIPGRVVLEALSRVKLDGVDRVVLSACVQMPSLDILADAARITGLPVTSAAQCTARALHRALQPVA